MVEYYYYQYQQNRGLVWWTVVDMLNILKSILHYPEHSLLTVTTKIEVCHFVTEWLTGD